MYAPSPQIRRSRAVAARAAAVSEYQPAPPHVGGAGLAAATGRRRALVPLGARRARAGEHRPAPAARCYCRTTADPGRADAVVLPLRSHRTPSRCARLPSSLASSRRPPWPCFGCGRPCCQRIPTRCGRYWCVLASSPCRAMERYGCRHSSQSIPTRCARSSCVLGSSPYPVR